MLQVYDQMMIDMFLRPLLVLLLLLAPPPPPHRRESTPVSMSTDVLLSLLMLSVKPSDGLRAGFVDVSAFVPECGCRPSCRRFSCRFWKPPRAGEVLPKFSTFL